MTEIGSRKTLDDSWDCQRLGGWVDWCINWVLGSLLQKHHKTLYTYVFLPKLSGGVWLVSLVLKPSVLVRTLCEALACTASQYYPRQWASTEESSLKCVSSLLAARFGCFVFIALLLLVCPWTKEICHWKISRYGMLVSKYFQETYCKMSSS